MKITLNDQSIRVSTSTNLFKYVKYIMQNNGATKAECIKHFHGIKGTPSETRGVASSTFNKLLTLGLVKLDRSTHIYRTTEVGAMFILIAEYKDQQKREARWQSSGFTKL